MVVMVKSWDVSTQKHGLLASGKSSKVFVPPPKHILKRREMENLYGNKRLGHGSVIVRVPPRTMPAMAKAIAYAAELVSAYFILERNVIADLVYLSDVDDDLSISFCSTTSFLEAYESEDGFDILVPSALAKQILSDNEDTLNDLHNDNDHHQQNNAVDMTIGLNLDLPYYLGMDGKTPMDQLDLVTILMHELVHGMMMEGGIEGPVNSYSQEASYAFAHPLITLFDYTLMDRYRKPLLETRPKSPYGLYNAIMNGPLFWSSDRNDAFPEAVLYNPPVYERGASIYHLNEETYPAGNENSLMTPFLHFGEAIHSLGPLVEQMANSMGYTLTQSSVLDLYPTQMTTSIGRRRGRLNSLRREDQSGGEDDPANYVEFFPDEASAPSALLLIQQHQTRMMEEERKGGKRVRGNYENEVKGHQTWIHFALPGYLMDGSAHVTDMALLMNFRGHHKNMQQWYFAVRDFAHKEWHVLGTNLHNRKATSAVWHPLYFGEVLSMLHSDDTFANLVSPNGTLRFSMYSPLGEVNEPCAIDSLKLELQVLF
ncbi:Por secretion system C-terminal sorting domain-containing protein [Balamuthia mandrillaris]